MHNTNSSEFEKVQYQEALNTLRLQYTMFTQIFTVLIIADVSIIGYSIHERLAGFLFFGILFPVSMIYVRKVIQRRMMPFIYTALIIENRQKSSGGEGIIFNYLSFINTHYKINQLIEIFSIEQMDERIGKVKEFFEDHRSKGIGYFLMVVAIGHIVGPVLLNYYFSFKWF